MKKIYCRLGWAKLLSTSRASLSIFSGSNFNQSRLAKFLPMWLQPSDKKSYYKAKPTSPAHPPYTGKDLGVFIKADDLILVSGLTTFLEEDILKPWALSFILRDELVQQAVKDFDSRRKTPNL